MQKFIDIVLGLIAFSVMFIWLTVITIIEIIYAIVIEIGLFFTGKSKKKGG